MRGVLRFVLVALAAASLAAYAYVALRRMSYPYDLEWIEGAILQHVERVERGRALYAEPSAGWAPLLYAPLYYLVCAALTPLFDSGLPLLRAVSFADSLGAMALAYLLVRRETASRAAGVLAAGLFAAVYDQSGGWFDLARVDSLMLLLLMGGVLAARYARNAPEAAAAGLLLVAATYSKQQAMFAVPALFLFLWFGRRDRRLALAFGATAATGIAAVYLAADAASDGWFSYYLFELGSQHPYAEQYLYLFFTADMGIVGLALLVAAAGVWRWWRQGDRERLWFYVPLVLALAAGAFLSRIHEGGYPNVVLPAYLAIALVTAAALGTERRRFAALLATAALVAQFGTLAYDPGKYVPSAEDEARSQRAVAAIRALPGNVYVTSYPIYGRRAGKPEFVHTAAAIDLMRADPSEVRDEFEARYEGAFDARCFSYVIGASLGNARYAELRPLLDGERLQALSGLPVPIGDVYEPRGGVGRDRARCPTPRG